MFLLCTAVSPNCEPPHHRMSESWRRSFASWITFYPHICSTLPVRDVVVGTISRALCLITVEKPMPEDEEFNFQCNEGMDSGDVDLMTQIE